MIIQKDISKFLCRHTKQPDNLKFEFDIDTLIISLTPDLPCAVSGVDIHICRACGDESSSLYNFNYADSIISNIELDGSLKMFSVKASTSNRLSI